MAKKRKKTTKAHSQTRKENGHSVSGQRKELVQRVYNFSSKEISRRLPESNSRLRIGMDFDNVRMKRRVAATLATLDELTKQVPGITEEVPEIFHLAEDWAQLNAIAAPAYDCEEEENTATLGAAIWMLDQIREKGKIRDAIRLMPKDDGPLDQIYIPPVWDPCHSDEVLLGMLYIIQNRNQDCVGPKDPQPTKEKPSQLERFYMDLLTAENKHHQQVDSRIRFETMLSMIPQDSIDRAVQHYQELFWDWVRRYYVCRNILLQKEIQLEQDRKAFTEQLRSEAVSMLQWMKKDVAKRREIVEGKTPLMYDQRPTYLRAMETPMADVMRMKANMEANEAALDERSVEIEDLLTSLQSMIRFLHTASFRRMKYELGEEITAVWNDIRIDDPYEILFAHLYLLDTGSDLPWVYAPGTSIFALAANSLPWSHCDYDDECDGIWNHYDEEAQDVVEGPADTFIPKKVKIPELEDWYSMDYSDRTFQDGYDHNRFNLSQIIFEITGGIMPRNMNRYLPALSDLEHFGITGKKTLHPLMYVMSLLGESRRQSKDWRLEVETAWDNVDAAGNLIVSDEPEETAASPEKLEAKIAELKKQLDHAKKTAYEANRELRESRKSQEKLEKKLAMEQQELADLRELVFHQQENLYQDATADESIEFPYKTTLRTVVFGGHDSWAREIKPKLPDVRFIDRTMLPNSDMIRRADVVWIQTNALSHAFFYKIIDEVRKHNKMKITSTPNTSLLGFVNGYLPRSVVVFALRQAPAGAVHARHLASRKGSDFMAKRRANGEGNIRKRKDGRWEGRYTAGYDPITGKQVFKNVLGKTQAEVKEKLKKSLELNEKIDFTRTGKHTVSIWMEEWFENVCKIKVRPSSHQTYRGYIDHHITTHIGKIPLEKLSTMDLQKLYRRLMSKGRVERIEAENQPKGLSAKTIRNINQVISSAMDFAVAQKIIPENPCKAVALPKIEHKEMQTIPAEQLQAFLTEARATGVYEMYYIELATGLRRGELLGLKWTDIDWKNGIIKVKRQVARVDGKIVEAPLKTKNSYRAVSISPQAIEVLRQQKAKTKDQYVFLSPNGGPISPDSVNNMLKRVLERASIPKVRFHDLRHTFATIALQNGVDIKTLSSMLGHFSAGFTLDTYAHVTTSAQKEAAQTMGNVLSM